MDRLVVDASVATAWVHPAQATTQTNALHIQIGQGTRVVVPALWPLEMANALTLSVHDAAYLELALRLKLPLACKDGPLREAAQRRRVQVVP